MKLTLFDFESTERCILWKNVLHFHLFDIILEPWCFFFFHFLGLLFFFFFWSCLLCRPSCSATKSFASWSRRLVRSYFQLFVLINIVFSCSISICSEQKKSKNVSPVYWVSLLPSNTRYNFSLGWSEGISMGCEIRYYYVFCWVSKVGRYFLTENYKLPFSFEITVNFRGQWNIVLKKCRSVSECNV